MKYESNTLMYSKDSARKPFFVLKGRDGTYLRTDKGDAISPPPPIINGQGIKTSYSTGYTQQLIDRKIIFALLWFKVAQIHKIF